MIAVIDESGEARISIGLFAEAGVIEIADDGTKVRVTANRNLAFSLIALLRVAIAQVDVLRGVPVAHGGRHAGRGVAASASRHGVSIEWPSDTPGNLPT